MAKVRFKMFWVHKDIYLSTYGHQPRSHIPRSHCACGVIITRNIFFLLHKIKLIIMNIYEPALCVESENDRTVLFTGTVLYLHLLKKFDIFCLVSSSILQLYIVWGKKYVINY